MSASMPLSFFAKLGAGCFVLGGCMELFMIKTGFYKIVTYKEAERWEENREENEEYRRRLLDSLKQKGIDIPKILEEVESKKAK